MEEAAKASCNYRTVLGDMVDVKSDDGIVTLTGKVRDRRQRTLAEDTVADLPGVVRVSNLIQVVAPAPEHSDGWIAFEIHSLLLVKAHVSAASTTVDVKSGAVTLGGTAGSVAQKGLTEFCASAVQGVTSVRNEMTVRN
jgi:hyperosmotically inducible periplasmic protein